MPTKLIALLFVIIIFLTGQSLVYASVTCKFTVDPAAPGYNGNNPYTFVIKNTGSSTVNFIKINAPADNFNITDWSTSGWSLSKPRDRIGSLYF